MAIPDVTATDLYERLGISEKASQEDIKTAYAEAVREFSPERDPEGFQRIREAYETLSDEESRSQYDATSNPAVEEALERGQEALQNENYEKAIEAFKRALVLEPDAHFIRNLLGVAYLHQEAHREALDQFRQLTEKVPHNHLYWAHRAKAEHELDKWAAAEEHYREAIDLEPEETSSYQGLATLLADREQFDEAEELIEQAIHADDVVDFDDISLFFELIGLRLRQGDVEGIEEVTHRVESVVTEEWQRQRVAYRFATLAQSLVELHAYDVALALAEKSEEFAPDDEEIAQFTRYIRQNRTLIDQWNELAEDDAIRANVKLLFQAGLQEYLDTWSSEGERQSIFGQIDDLVQAESNTAVVGNGKRRSLKDELNRIESKYPRLTELFQSGYLSQLKQLSAGADPYVWLTCPHCSSQARAKDDSGEYECPECGESFNYDRSSAEVDSGSNNGCASVIGKIIMYGFWLFVLIGLAQSC